MQASEKHRKNCKCCPVSLLIAKAAPSSRCNDRASTPSTVSVSKCKHLEKYLYSFCGPSSCLHLTPRIPNSCSPARHKKRHNVTHGNISEIKRGIIDPLVSKRPGTNSEEKNHFFLLQKLSKMVKMVKNGPKWSKIGQNG